MKKIIIAAIALIITASFLLTSCSNSVIEKREDTQSDDSVAITDNSNVITADTSADTGDSVQTGKIPEYFNPLTGLETSKELSQKRPIAVMINNIEAAMPQEGTSFADVIYECIVEGAQTRLMALYLDYKDVPVIGSVRSSREYFLDFAQNHDAIYVHAGGSDKAYKQIKSRKINNLDGVNMYLPDVFYRDAERLKTHAYEHTLMTSGEKIASGIEFKDYRTDIKNGFASPFNFTEYGTVDVPDGNDAKYIGVTYAPFCKPYFKYNEDNKTYERYQFDERQTDNNTGAGLEFQNVIIIYCKTFNTNDNYGHYNVNDIGEGDGYYFSCGKYIKIKWKKSDADSPISFSRENGDELIINRGKTFVQVCTEDMRDTTVISDGTQNG